MDKNEILATIFIILMLPVVNYIIELEARRYDNLTEEEKEEEFLNTWP